MSWSRRTGAGRAGSEATPSVQTATVSPQRLSSRRMVLVAAVWLVILVSLTDVVRVDGFVVEPAPSSASFQRRQNDSVSPSTTGQLASLILCDRQTETFRGSGVKEK